MKSIPEARRYLPGTVEVRPAKGVALIEQKMRVGDIQRRDDDRPLRPKRLAPLQVEDGVRWLVRRTVALQKP